MAPIRGATTGFAPMRITEAAIVLGHGGPGRTAALAAFVRAYGSETLGTALARGARAGLGVAHGPGVRGTLELGSASRLRGSAYALFREASVVAGAPPPDAVALGLSEYAYYGLDDFEPYRALGRPLPAPLPGTPPDPTRPWAIVEGMRVAEARVMLRDLAARDPDLERDGIAEAQLHTFLPQGAVAPGLEPGVVRWLDWPGAVGAVLGHTRVVLCREGPLAWDALRLGRVYVRVPSERPLDEPLARPGLARDHRLAAVIPPVLLSDPRTLRALIDEGPAGFSRYCNDVGRKREAIEARIAESGIEGVGGVERAVRRWRKLRQEPGRFMRESRYRSVREVGEWVGRRR